MLKRAVCVCIYIYIYIYIYTPFFCVWLNRTVTEIGCCVFGHETLHQLIFWPSFSFGGVKQRGLVLGCRSFHRIWRSITCQAVQEESLRYFCWSFFLVLGVFRTPLWAVPHSSFTLTIQLSSWRVTQIFQYLLNMFRRSQWPLGLTRRSAAARLLRSWVRIPPGAWMFVCCECCVLSGRGLCDELITHSEESYRLWCVVVRDLETSRLRRPWPALGRSATKKN